MSTLLGAHRPGHSWLHRRSAGVKLSVLLVVSVVVVLAPGPWWALGALLVAGLVLGSTGAGGRLLFGTLRGVLLVSVVLGGWLSWQQGWARAVATVGDLLALVLLSTALTVTTPIDEMLDTITRALGPLRRIGVRPESVALAFSLMLRALPTTIALAEQTRDAARARGLQRDPRARLVPLVIRVVAHAHATGDALHARGVGDD